MAHEPLPALRNAPGREDPFVLGMALAESVSIMGFLWAT